MKHIAEVTKQNTRTEDVVARIGGDEFIIFMEYTALPEEQVKRIFSRITQKFGDFNVSVSMGVACADGEVTDYKELFEKAEKAAYSVKNDKKNAYRFYDGSMANVLKNRGVR